MEIIVNADSVDLTTVIGERRAYDHDEGYSTEPATLGDAVARDIAERLWATYGDNELIDVRRRVAAIRDEEIRARVAPIVESAVTEPVQRTNGYGEPTGKATTLRELIIAEVHSYLGKRSDYGRGPMTVETFVKAEVDKAIKAELAEVIKEEKAKVVAAVRAKAADLIAQAVKEGIGR